MHLGADVIAIRGAPGVLDHAETAIAEAKSNDAVIDIVEFGEARLYLDCADRKDLVDFIAHEKARGVEVVNAEIPEETAAGAEIVDWRNAIAGEPAEHLDLTNRAGINQFLRSRVTWIEPALKRDLEGNAGGANGFGDVARVSNASGHRFLGEDRLASVRGRNDVLAMEIRGRDDDDR